ncbi:hypothetical protein VZG47_12800 [Synechococcus elongatus IITB5]
MGVDGDRLALTQSLGGVGNAPELPAIVTDSVVGDRSNDSIEPDNRHHW